MQEYKAKREKRFLIEESKTYPQGIKMPIDNNKDHRRNQDNPAWSVKM